MKLIRTIATCGATLALSGLAFAGPGEDIIAKEKCGSCHTATTTKKAPSFACTSQTRAALPLAIAGRFQTVLLPSESTTISVVVPS